MRDPHGDDCPPAPERSVGPGQFGDVLGAVRHRVPAGLHALGIRPDPVLDYGAALRPPAVAQALLVDDSPEHAVAMHRLIAQAGAGTADVLCADLTAASTYEGRVPADLVVLGSRLTTGTEPTLTTIVEALPRLCTRAAVVAWLAAGLHDEREALLRRLLDRAGFDSAQPAPEDAWHHARFVGVPVRLEQRRL